MNTVNLSQNKSFRIANSWPAKSTRTGRAEHVFKQPPVASMTWKNDTLFRHCESESEVGISMHSMPTNNRRLLKNSVNKKAVKNDSESRRRQGNWSTCQCLLVQGSANLACSVVHFIPAYLSLSHFLHGRSFPMLWLKCLLFYCKEPHNRRGSRLPVSPSLTVPRDWWHAFFSLFSGFDK